jgi:hypothetical protein
LKKSKCLSFDYNFTTCLITDGDETDYREEVRVLAVWCQGNNISINVSKTKELMVDYRRKRREHVPHPH